MIQEQIKEAIEKNLPSMVANELKDYIAKAEVDKKRIIDRDEKIENLMNQLKESQKLNELAIKNISTLNLELSNFKAREHVIKDAETKILIADKEAEKERAVAQSVMNIVEKVFSNRSFRYTEYTTENINGQVPSAQGYLVGVTNNKNVTRKVEGQD